MTEAVVTVRNLSLESDRAILRNVSVTLDQGKVLGIVGESGSGKTLLVKSILGVLPTTVRATSGHIELFGEDSATFDTATWRSLWANKFGAVFQDPGSYLNPSYTVLQHFEEFYRVALRIPKEERRRRALDALRAVNIRDAEAVLTRYRHELSGGTLQRIVIALALARSPEVFIADEATTSLDVTVEAEVLDLIADLRNHAKMSVIVVSHDLSVVSRLADDLIVLRNGVVVEAGPTQRLLREPRSEYLRLLIDSYTKYGIDRVDAVAQTASVG
ncbi:ABC transporter ATP-binding protein [Mycobacterium sp. 236(2023)]|uniref:ATP-binding cassette domain-containing protein n=1 Tax=Mycobacterium sp. 236(2023) TaxID=3038163 RepID=UPI0024153FE6|nr:ABC transporter ATP-binding protein [Mycobacterium sp. 236(2023)]MDG4667657.1 ABC transporter ATP-binding protein [Mycobacterium sp. 236(2023)]